MKQQPTLSSIPTAPVLMAALALVSGYGNAVAGINAGNQDVGHRNESSQQTAELASSVHALIKNLKTMEDSFNIVIKKMLAGNPVRMPDHMDAHQSLDDLGSTLESFRGMELALRTSPVPDGLGSLHMDLRRGMARARENLAITHSLISQMVTVPEITGSRINLEGLRALAEHSTKRLIQLANA